MKLLYIAEKPSLAEAIAGAIGKPIKKSGYYEVGENYVVWLYGHVLQLFDAKDYDEKYKRWLIRDLPIIPTEFRLKPSNGAHVKRSLDTIQMLLPKVEAVVHAGDPDREGRATRF